MQKSPSHSPGHSPLALYWPSHLAVLVSLYNLGLPHYLPNVFAGQIDCTDEELLDLVFCHGISASYILGVDNAVSFSFSSLRPLVRSLLLQVPKHPRISASYCALSPEDKQLVLQ